MRRVAIVIGLVAFALLVRELGWTALTRVLVETGGWFAVIAAIDVGSGLCDAAGIRSFARRRTNVPYARCVVAQLSGVAINRLAPSGALGEPVKISVLAEHMPRDEAVSTILKFDVTATCIGIATIVLGVPLTLAMIDLPPAVEIAAWSGAAVLCAFAALLILLVRRGAVGVPIAVLARLRVISRERARAWTAKVSELDAHVRELGSDWRSMPWLFASRALNWVGTIVLLHAAGLPVTAPLVIGILSVGLLVQVISHIVPLGLGIAEGGNYVLYAALGAAPLAGIDYTTAYRARIVVVAAVGLTTFFVGSLNVRRGGR